MGSLNNANPVSWAQHSYTYIATTTEPIVRFGFDGISEQCVFVDDVSVVDTLNPSVELLDNPGFENSSLSLVGWVTWCSLTCGSGSEGAINSGSDCRASGNCFRGQCRSSGTDFLGQTFSALIGRTYSISFWFQQVRLSSGGGSIILYIDVI